MKIVSFDEFAALPEGTIFSYYRPAVCEGLFRKGATLSDDDGRPRDFFLSSLVPDCWNGEHPCVGEGSRWGMFDYDQQFAVFEEADLAVLREWLAATPAIR